MYSIIRSLLFQLEPEVAHNLTLRAICLAGGLPFFPSILRYKFQPTDKPVQVFGLDFCNPVGLAAGYDKDGVGWSGLACLGFGHIEIGTVTLQPQPGNPRPRIFRLPGDRALINRMGFPGQGAVAVAKRLTGRRPPGLILGVNIGKNKDTPLEVAADDYVALVKIFAARADYLAINVSSPNTVGLRRLQAREMLESLLIAVNRERCLQEHQFVKKLPILVKLAPDLSDAELDDALAAIHITDMDGIVATNTTVSRNGVKSRMALEAGGLSGAPLTRQSRAMVAKITSHQGNRLPVIGVGGIMMPSDAREMFAAGASLVQVYTGLVYAGPSLVQKIVKEIS